MREQQKSCGDLPYQGGNLEATVKHPIHRAAEGSMSKDGVIDQTEDGLEWWHQYPQIGRQQFHLVLDGQSGFVYEACQRRVSPVFAVNVETAKQILEILGRQLVAEVSNLHFPGLEERF